MESRRNKTIGEWGEEQACLFLARKGFVVSERNYHTTTGEIDIVAHQGGDYYFIEVKTRHAGALANDLAITKSKKHKMEKAVKTYCYRKNLSDGSIILAGLLVIINRLERKVAFRLAVYC